MVSFKSTSTEHWPTPRFVRLLSGRSSTLGDAAASASRPREVRAIGVMPGFYAAGARTKRAVRPATHAPFEKIHHEKRDEPNIGASRTRTPGAQDSWRS